MVFQCALYLLAFRFSGAINNVVVISSHVGKEGVYQQNAGLITTKNRNGSKRQKQIRLDLADEALQENRGNRGTFRGTKIRIRGELGNKDLFFVSSFSSDSYMRHSIVKGCLHYMILSGRLCHTLQSCNVNSPITQSCMVLESCTTSHGE